MCCYYLLEAPRVRRVVCNIIQKAAMWISDLLSVSVEIISVVYGG
jgi:hypothetical protein